mgnify:CR=1 FL=1
MSSSGFYFSTLNQVQQSYDQGIIEIDQSFPIATKLSDVYKNLCDDIIEIYVTPNRGDCLGLYGIARDLSAKGIGELAATPALTDTVLVSYYFKKIFVNHSITLKTH